MLHLDEGTIHAWLDGELSPEESESAALHVAECAECRELVTEARGLMAGATRIVSALDAGPAGVVPRTQRGPISSRRPWYRFAMTPTRMSIAAMIVVAVGLSLTARRMADNSSVRARLIDKQMDVTAPAVSPTVRADSVSAPRERQTATPLNLPAAPPSPIVSAKGKNAAPAPVPAASPPPSASPSAVAEQKATLADKRTITDAASKQVAAAPPSAAPAPPVARLDSIRAKDEMAKVSVDSVSRAQVPLAQRRTFVSTNVNQLSEVVATSARDADPTRVVVLPNCYRLAIDSTEWRGILPAAFALDQSVPRDGGGGAGRGGAGGGAVAGSAVGAAAGAPKTAAQPASSNMTFSAGVRAAGVVRALAPNGRVDSTVVGVWYAASTESLSLRFTTADPSKPVTVLLAGSSSTARVTSGDRTDSVRVARTSCPR
jgi:hypothetical protein